MAYPYGLGMGGLFLLLCLTISGGSPDAATFTLKVREKLDYMYAKPVNEKLVEHPNHWPWSSWSAYVGKAALLSIDFNW